MNYIAFFQLVFLNNEEQLRVLKITLLVGMCSSRSQIGGPSSVGPRTVDTRIVDPHIVDPLQICAYPDPKPVARALWTPELLTPEL